MQVVELLLLDEGFDHLFFGLEVGTVVEQRVFMRLKPLLSLDLAAAEEDEVDEHGVDDGHDGEGVKELKAQCGSTFFGRISDLDRN